MSWAVPALAGAAAGAIAGAYACGSAGTHAGLIDATPLAAELGPPAAVGSPPGTAGTS